MLASEVRLQPTLYRQFARNFLRSSTRRAAQGSGGVARGLPRAAKSGQGGPDGFG
jgi:hypothetical protein